LVSPYQVTADFEQALCNYTGARYAVAVNSGSAAILLACKYFQPITTIDVPCRTYVSVPMSVIHAGHRVNFVDKEWVGEYRLAPLPVWDSACRFTSNMFRPGDIQCVSFAAAKILGVEQGGALLHDRDDADAWFKAMRFDGRTAGLDVKDDAIALCGFHCLMIPSVAASLLVKLFHLPKHNQDIRNSSCYPDISGFQAFK
jgi:dTDP-4-amino-4,6-dideoxygalactose transaminase